VFSIRPHKQNYLLFGRYTTNVNSTPSSPTRGTLGAPSLRLDEVEARFQLSFKTKVIEGLGGDRADLWVGYTQQSSWQVYNDRISRPFRETNYEPEIMLVVRTDYDFLGLRGRFVNVGLVHQSNGRAEPLSRSWNRLYAQFGFERGGFSLLVRPWYRLREKSADKDDNPDITQYLGYGDVLAIYQRDGHTWSLQLRSNLNAWNFRGAAQADWSFPLHGLLRGYVQVITGYGETLIDYNHAQTTVGAGVLLTNWQ
jgi:phospholipase A1